MAQPSTFKFAPTLSSHKNNGLNQSGCEAQHLWTAWVNTHSHLKRFVEQGSQAIWIHYTFSTDWCQLITPYQHCMCLWYSRRAFEPGRDCFWLDLQKYLSLFRLSIAIHSSKTTCSRRLIKQDDEEIYLFLSEFPNPCMTRLSPPSWNPIAWAHGHPKVIWNAVSIPSGVGREFSSSPVWLLSRLFDDDLWFPLADICGNADPSEAKGECGLTESMVLSYKTSHIIPNIHCHCIHLLNLCSTLCPKSLHSCWG